MGPEDTNKSRVDDFLAHIGETYQLMGLEASLERDRSTGIGIKAHEQPECTTEPCGACWRVATKACGNCAGFYCERHIDAHSCGEEED